MKLAMIGSGYVGLVSGVCFAELEHEVICVDNNPEKIAQLERFESPIYEPGLEPLIKQNVEAGKLSFTTDLPAAVKAADAVFIAVGTPSRAEDGHADLQYVFAAAKEIGEAIEKYTLVVTKSTVPVGTGRQIANTIKKANAKAEFDIASNPEFLREGSAIGDFMNPDRIVCGVRSDKAQTLLEELYAPLTKQGVPLLSCEVETSEMIKYASNSFLATKIAFINEMADVCEKVGANVEEVARGMGLDTRIGEKFLKPGPGFGGSCFPKDALALAQLAEVHGIHPQITNTVIRYNIDRKFQMVDKIVNAFGGSVAGKNLAVLGLTFKANTDDMRESPALAILPKLMSLGASIKTYDPQGMANAKMLISGDVEWCEGVFETLQDADAVIILTEWDEFKNLPLEKVRATLKTPMIIDLRNLYTPKEMAEAGFVYYSIGRSPVMMEYFRKEKEALSG